MTPPPASSDPGSAKRHHAAGLAAAQAGRMDEAIAHLRQAVRVDPALLEAWADLGRLLLTLRQEDEAIRCFEAAARIRPEVNQVIALGAYFLRRSQVPAALRYFEQAKTLKPRDATLLCRISELFLDVFRPELAEAWAREACEIEPKSVIPQIQVAKALLQPNRLEEAIQALRHALVLDPRAAAAHAKLGEALARLGQQADAEEAIRRAIQLEPRSSSHWVDLAKLFLMASRPDDALAAARQAIAIDPRDYFAHTNAARALLVTGRLEEGWTEYEWRYSQNDRPVSGEKLWDGSPLNGQRIILRAEQGFGDTIQFVRYAPLVRDRGGRVIVQCPRPLQQLMRTLDGVAEVAVSGEPVKDAQLDISMLSLPHRFGTTLSTIPARVPYLHHDEARVPELRQRLSHLSGLKVGIAWSGNPLFPSDRARSMPLSALAPLAKIAGINVIGLQKGPPTPEDQTLMAELNVTDLGSACDLLDLAAAMTLLDLVISVDSAPAHLAGSLARPVWLLLSSMADWRWMLDRDDSPWYPTMRIFRQTTPGQWADVIERVAQALRESVARGSLT